MATHCSVLVCFGRTWWWGSILLVCLRRTWWWGSILLVCQMWGRSIPLTLLWLTTLNQFEGMKGIINWEFLWGYWRRRGAFRFKWTVRKGCRIHVDGGSAWRDNNRLEWTRSGILRHEIFVWNRDIMAACQSCMKVTSWLQCKATSSLYFHLWYVIIWNKDRVNSSIVSIVNW